MRHPALLTLALLLAACQGGGEQGNAADPASGNAAGSAGGPTPKATPAANLAQFVAGSAEHKMLARAVQAAGLSATLSGAGPYTLFAPTDAAFAKLPAGAAEGLMQPAAKGRLTRLLVFHAGPGVVMAQDIERAIDKAGGTAKLATLGGGTLTFARVEGGLSVTDGRGGTARVTGADAVASNGVVHSVDAVLMSAEGR
jgi:uncharacterized surface protein with fasciclin (FAS1) repeats